MRVPAADAHVPTCLASYGLAEYTDGKAPVRTCCKSEGFECIKDSETYYQCRECADCCAADEYRDEANECKKMASTSTSSTSTPDPITTPPASSNSSRPWTVTLDVDVPFSPADFTLLVFARDFLHPLRHTHLVLSAGHLL